MSEKRTNLEIIAPSVEEAVERGLADLGLSEEDVEVEVLDSGSRGLFGLGSRQARVRLTIKSGPGETPPAVERVFTASATDLSTVAPETEEDLSAAPVKSAEEAVSADKRLSTDDVVLHVARETVVELLERMQVYAEVTARFGEAEDAQSRQPVYVDIRGEDLSILIGPKAETLNALQYITGLIMGKELGRSIPLVVDVEGYRLRRADQIRKLARRMADQAVKSGRRQTLEPMPANERRLVHIELRNYPGVTTESTGEDPRRKVMIIPE